MFMKIPMYYKTFALFNINVKTLILASTLNNYILFPKLWVLAKTG